MTELQALVVIFQLAVVTAILALIAKNTASKP
jgi:hypothetical protein